jgi:hypothetical protein
MATPAKRKIATRKSTTRQKVRDHRARLREQGLRPVQIWVPDTRSPAFLAEARRQMRRLAKSPLAAEDQAFIDAISEGVWD